jgi:predicted Zn finger-like uncharacterized protein
LSDAPGLRTTCPSCGVRYRLDPTRFTGQKANIKCSRCGTVFRVRVAQPSRETSTPWIVVHADTGREEVLASLDTVKRLIIEGAVGADDTLSRGAGGARRIGDIEQLHSFLRVGERSGSFPSVAVEPVSGNGNGTPRAADALAADALATEASDAAAPAEEDEDQDEPAAVPMHDQAREGVSEPQALPPDDEDGDTEHAGDADDTEEADEAEGDAEDAEDADDADRPPEDVEVSEPRPLLDTVRDDALVSDDRPVALDTGAGRMVALVIAGLVVLAALVLAALYFSAPDAFYSLLPFLR